MQDKRIQDERTTDGLSQSDHERAVIELLLCDRVPWTVEEIVREVSSERLEVIDAVAGLTAAGLLHRHGEFAFPTRAARRADEIGISEGAG
jgi:predicted transcriptional regulator